MESKSTVGQAPQRGRPRLLAAVSCLSGGRNFLLPLSQFLPFPPFTASFFLVSPPIFLVTSDPLLCFPFYRRSGERRILERGRLVEEEEMEMDVDVFGWTGDGGGEGHGRRGEREKRGRKPGRTI